MKIAGLGIDQGKNVCSLVGLDESGAVVMRRRARRELLVEYVGKLPPCIVGMEACCGAHHLGRLFASQGHDVRLMSPEYVRPYVKAQKNDDRDAEGIAEAATRPTMRFVAIKSEAQRDMQTLHRSSDRLVGCQFALNRDPGFASNSDPFSVVSEGARRRCAKPIGVARAASPEGALGNGDQLRFLKRQLVLPVSMISQW